MVGLGVLWCCGVVVVLILLVLLVLLLLTVVVVLYHIGPSALRLPPRYSDGRGKAGCYPKGVLQWIQAI